MTRFLSLLNVKAPVSRRWEFSILGIAVLIILGSHLWIGLRSDWLPCTLDCGETYEAYVGARNIDRFGWRYNHGLQDYSSSPDLATHATNYVHNPNLGMYFFVLLFKLGVRGVHAQAAWLTLPFLLGMAYLYLAVKAVTRDGLLAACCLLSAATLYLLVEIWGYQAVRVWSFPLTWGFVYHITRWARMTRRLNLAIAMLLMGFSLGVDYPYAAFIAALAVALWWVGLVQVRFLRLMLIVTVAIGGPFILRQIQVASVLGLDFWKHDFTYSVIRRIPLASLFFTVSDSVTLTKYYEAHHAIAWPGGGGPAIFLTWAFVLIRAHMATLGWPSLALGLAGLYAGWLRARVQGPVNSGLALLVAFGLAFSATMLLFGEYLSVFYGVILMPMAVHWITLLLGMTTYVLIAHRRTCVTWGRFRIGVGAVALAAFIIWRVGTEAHNMIVLPPAGYPGRHALAELRGHSVATLWISSAPSAYTDQWAATLRTMRWLTKTPHRFLFSPEDEYYMFFEVDRDNPRYRRPEFLLVPRLRVWGFSLLCQPLSGWIVGFADGCAYLEVTAKQLADLPVYRRGKDFLLYDLREIRR